MNYKHVRGHGRVKRKTVKPVTNYDLALEQFLKETSWNERDFKLKIEDHGWDYVTYYYSRYIEERVA